VSEVLVPETALSFPSHTVVTASAGAGKTYTLSWRYVQYLLSTEIPRNKLWNLLAVTFTKNAAAEMKQRILQHLKKMALKDEESLKQASVLLSGTNEELSQRADKMLDHVLQHYSDFQVQTIDSFLERIFRSSALDLKLPPDFEVELSSQNLFSEAFSEFAKSMNADSSELSALFTIIESYEHFRSSSAKFLWKPTSYMRDSAKALHDYIVTLDKGVERYDAKDELERINRDFVSELIALKDAAAETGFDLQKNFLNLCDKVSANGIGESFGKKSLETPLKKGKHSDDEKNSVMALLQPHIDNLLAIQGQYVRAEARGSFTPALHSIDAIRAIIDDIKWKESRVLIQDVSTTLNDYLRNQDIPAVYFRLGEQIAHFFMDEFQDTSPVQWAVMLPLIEHALAESGSLFVVGDPKQSINLFRGADWQIMMDLAAKNIFPSSAHQPRSLASNFRSGEHIVEYSKALFCGALQGDDYDAALRSGLHDFSQKALDKMKGKGYTELISIPSLAEESEEELDDVTGSPEEDALIKVIKDCNKRGFSYRDIGVLASKNSEIVVCGQWLNKHGIPFVSHSSLDVRQRKIAGETFQLLSFLDSPINDFAFANVILGEMFGRWAEAESEAPGLDEIRALVFNNGRAGSTTPLYKSFESAYPEMYAALFDPLLRIVGYLPSYDLLTAAFSALRVFEYFPEEESALIKLLEAAVDAAGFGSGGHKSYLALANEDDEGELWSMQIPVSLNAVQLMTIHKAKGLEFPVAIVMMYDRDAPRPDYFIEDTDEHYRLLRLRKDRNSFVPEFEDIYTEQCLKYRADTLNRLYVACTRPELELYMISVFKDRAQSMPSPMLQAGPGQTGAKTLEYSSKAETVQEAPRRHNPVPMTRSAKEFKPYDARESLRGEWIHAILSEIDFIQDDFEDRLLSLVNERAIPVTLNAEEISNDIMRFFQWPELRGWFSQKAGRSVHCELDVVS
jgi:ATP-dependent exoDNAse (exonuclease V) beta subunit